LLIYQQFVFPSNKTLRFSPDFAYAGLAHALPIDLPRMKTTIYLSARRNVVNAFAHSLPAIARALGNDTKSSLARKDVVHGLSLPEIA
jgi:hypothetical protein